MRPRLSVTRSAVELIKAFEGFRPKAMRLDDGRWTIAYGHTLTAREGKEVSEPDGEALLMYDLIQAAHAVNELVFAPLTQNQFDALVAFVFNIGERQFRASPTLRRLNEGRPLEAAMAMEMWRKADLEGERIVIDALVRRRAAEKAVFLRPMEGWIPAPTPVLTPRIDYDAAALIPLSSPVAARAAVDGDRLYAERAPVAAAATPAEEASASAAAASAVIERLEAILNEDPAKAATAPATTTATEPETAAPHDPTRFVTAKTAPAPAPWRMLGLALLTVLGVTLVAIAAMWGQRPPPEQVLGVPPAVAALATGGLGAVLFSIGLYLLLERLGRPRPPASSN